MPTQIPSSGLAPGAVTEDKIAGSVNLGGPKINSIDYPGDDTAALPAGGQTINVTGAGFQSGCVVYVDGSIVSVVSFISSFEIEFIAPAKSTGLYTLYVVNPDGGTAIGVPGMVYSGTPTWTTASGSLGSPYETTAVSVNLAATGDGALTYALTSGSSLPTGLTLTSAGLLSGTVPATAVDTTYTFNVDVIDAENQSTTRQFSVTYLVDVVTWSSPADGASFEWTEGQANSTTLVATSAAGAAVSFAVQSGSLPSNVTIAGNLITGTPDIVTSNTAVTVRATAADTLRYADQTLYFTVASGAVAVFAGGNNGSFNTYYNTIDYFNMSSTGNALDFGDLSTTVGAAAGNVSSSTRAVTGGGLLSATSRTASMQYLTMQTLGNSAYFGNLSEDLFGVGGCSNSTRGVYFGGRNSSANISTMQYITIASIGNATFFGDMGVSQRYNAGCGSSTRGLLAIFGENSYRYITIASTGNALFFGNLTAGISNGAPSAFGSNSVRAINQAQNGGTSVIEYLTIATLGNAVYFGDFLFANAQGATAAANATKVVFAGSENAGNLDTICYVTIASLGNALDFGNLTVGRRGTAGFSSAHGGL